MYASGSLGYKATDGSASAHASSSEQSFSLRGLKVTAPQRSMFPQASRFSLGSQSSIDQQMAMKEIWNINSALLNSIYTDTGKLIGLDCFEHDTEFETDA
jgi:hypothetical protein